MKKIIYVLFPFLDLFTKDSLKRLKPLFDRLILASQLFLLTLTIPISISILHILFGGVLGMDSVYGFWETFYHIWVGFYINGYFLGIISYKWQFFLFCISFFITFTE